MTSHALRWSGRVTSPAGLDPMLWSGQLAHGPVARETERALAIRHGVSHSVLTNTGTAAIMAALLWLRQTTEKRSIIVPAFGYIAAANVAASLGFKLYVADVEEDAPVIDPESAARLMDDTVAAIIGINYFGWSVDWKKVVCPPAVVKIEDAAGSFGSFYAGVPAGANADCAIMSFHVSKSVSAGGEGGALITNNEQMASEVRAIAKHGQSGGYYESEMLGSNLLMTDVAALFLRQSLIDYPTSLSRRAAVSRALEAVCREFGISAHRSNQSSPDRTQNYQAFVVLEDHRDRLLEYLRLGGIEARPCWPRTLMDQAALAPSIVRVDREGTNSRAFSRRVLNLPIHPDVTSDQIERLRSALRAWRS